MTLLETLVAIVILGLTSVGFLELFQGTARATRSADEWLRASAYAEALLEGAKLEEGVPAPGEEALPDGFARRVERTPWRDGLDDVSVTVTLPTGARFTVHRLVRRR